MNRLTLALVAGLLFVSQPGLSEEPCPDPAKTGKGPVPLDLKGLITPIRNLSPSQSTPQPLPQPLPQTGPQKLPTKNCYGYPYSHDSFSLSGSGAHADGERNYSYGRLFENDDEKSQGAKVIRSLIANPALSRAIHQDEAARKAIFADEDVRGAFDCDSNYKKIMEEGPSLKFLFTESSGTGYTVSEHSARVINRYTDQKQFYDFSAIHWPSGFRTDKTDSFMETLLAFHDIGKSIAVRSGNKSRQAEFNGPYVMTLMKASGFNDAEIRLAHALEQNDDTIGAYLQGKIKLNEALAEMKKWAESAKISPEDFFTLQKLYHVCDAGSYRDLEHIFKKLPGGRQEARDFKFKVLSFQFRNPNRVPLVSGPEGEAKYGNGPISSTYDYSGAGSDFVNRLVKHSGISQVLSQDEELKRALGATIPNSNLRFDPDLASLLAGGASMRFVLGLPIRPEWNLDSAPTIGEQISRNVHGFKQAERDLLGPKTLTYDNHSKAVAMTDVFGYVTTARSLHDSLAQWLGTKTTPEELSTNRLLERLVAAAGFPPSVADFAKSVAASGALTEVFKWPSRYSDSPEQHEARLIKMRDKIFAEADAMGLKGKELDYFRLISEFYQAAQRDGASALSRDTNYEHLRDYMITGQLPRREEPPIPLYTPYKPDSPYKRNL